MNRISKGQGEGDWRYVTLITNVGLVSVHPDAPPPVIGLWSTTALLWYVMSCIPCYYACLDVKLN